MTNTGENFRGDEKQTGRRTFLPPEARASFRSSQSEKKIEMLKEDDSREIRSSANQFEILGNCMRLHKHTKAVLENENANEDGTGSQDVIREKINGMTG